LKAISEVSRVKASIREMVWRTLERENVAAFPRPVYGRIPNFICAREAAERLVESTPLRGAETVKVNPDAPQQWVRRLLLQMGKTIIMPTPRLREGFLLLDPRRIPPASLGDAATIKGAFTHGVKVGLEQIPSIDFIVEGSVAVSERGGRLGKGEGYAEIEYGILREIGVVTESTPIATTVHDLQLVADIPMEPFDVPVDLIVTPTRCIETRSGYPRPNGIIWHLLDDRKLREIPLLSSLIERSRGGR
jgi:5-formyltetrahydrofolate cyclo-ligase